MPGLSLAYGTVAYELQVATAAFPTTRNSHIFEGIAFFLVVHLGEILEIRHSR